MKTLLLPNGHLFQFGDWAMLAAGKKKRRKREAEALAESYFGDGPETTCLSIGADPPFFVQEQWDVLRAAVGSPREWFVKTVMPRFYELIDWRNKTVARAEHGLGLDSSAAQFTNMDGEFMLLLIAMNELLEPHELEVQVDGFKLKSL